MPDLLATPKLPRATPPFTIQGCTAADGHLIPKNNVPAFYSNSNWRLIWTRVNKSCEYVTSQASLRFAHSQLITKTERRRHQKVVDANGQIVGYCRWVLPEGVDENLWPEAKVPAVSEEAAAKFKADFDGADWNPDHALDDDDKPMQNMKRPLLAKKNYFLLDYLAVHPDHRRQGIAAMLVAEGLKVADKLQFDTFVLAFADGKHVYDRAGFVLLGQIVQNDRQWGGEGDYWYFFMERTVENAVNLEPVAKKDG